jgi:hypothetical protein
MAYFEMSMRPECRSGLADIAEDGLPGSDLITGIYGRRLIKVEV